MLLNYLTFLNKLNIKLGNICSILREINSSSQMLLTLNYTGELNRHMANMSTICSLYPAFQKKLIFNMAFKEVIALSFMCFLEHNAALLFHGESNPGPVTTLGPLGTDATLSVLVIEVFDLKEVRNQCPYLLKFVDIVL